MKRTLKTSIVVAVAAGLASCGKDAPQETVGYEPAQPQAPEMPAEVVEESIPEVPAEPKVQFTKLKSELSELILEQDHDAIFSQLGEPFEKEELNQRESIWRYRGDITQPDGAKLTILELIVSGRKPKVRSFGFPETYDPSRNDTMMDEPDFRAATKEKSYEEIAANLGEPTFFQKKDNALIYHMWIKRDDTAYRGVRLYQENGNGIYRDYSFILDGKKQVEE